MNCAAQPIWIADAHRDDGKRFVVRADEKLSVFWNLNQRFAIEAILRIRVSCLEAPGSQENIEI